MKNKEEQTAPKLRFKGYTDAWQQRHISEISKRIIRKNKNLTSLRPLTISAQYGLVDQTKFFNKQVASKDLSNYLLLFKGDFAYNKSYSSDAPYGAVKQLVRYKSGVVSSLYFAFKINENINNNFVKYYFDSDKWHKNIYENAAEGARNHGLLNITAQDFFSGNLKISSSKFEQDKIGLLLSKLDSTITLLQRRNTELISLKRRLNQHFFRDTYMEKFTKRSICSLGKIYSGLSGKNKNDFGHGKGHYITYININRNLVSDINGIDAIEIDNKQNFVKNGDILFTLSSETPEEVGLASVWLYNLPNTYLNSFSFGFRPNKQILNSLYLGYLFRSDYFRKKSFPLAQGISRYNLSKKSFLKLDIPIPTLKSQQQIAHTLYTTDKLISENKCRISILSDLKKFLLQNMFI